MNETQKKHLNVTGYGSAQPRDSQRSILPFGASVTEFWVQGYTQLFSDIVYSSECVARRYSASTHNQSTFFFPVSASNR